MNRTASTAALQIRWPRAIGLVLALSFSLAFWSAVAWTLKAVLR